MLRRILAFLPLVLVLAAVGPVVAPVVADEELDFGLELRDLSSLDFVGNTVWSDGELRSLIQLEGSPWYAPWRADRYRLDWLEQGIVAIRARYAAAGYRSVRVLLDEPRPSGGGDSIVIRIKEGPRTLVRRVEFEGAEPLDVAELKSLLVYQEGQPAPYGEAALGGDLYRVLDAYLSRGHLEVVVRNRIVDPDSTGVTVRYEVEAGPVYRVRSIRVRGARRVPERFVLRELAIREGEAFEVEDQALSEARLLETGWFRNVNFEAVALDSVTGLADLAVVVSERPTAFWEVGLGTGSRDRVRLVGAWGDRNFLGTGKGLTLRARVFGVYDVRVANPDRNNLYWDHEEEILYRHPHLLGTRKTLTARGFNEVETRPSTALQIDRQGLGLGSTVLGRGHNSLDSELSFTRTRKNSLDDAINFDSSREKTFAFALAWRRDLRDDFANPERGYYLELFAQTAGGPVLRGDNSFNKITGSVVKLFDFGPAVFAVHVHAGWSQAYSKSEDLAGPYGGVPIEERFFAGGSKSVRGYRESSLGPRLQADDLTSVQDPRFLFDRLSGGGSASLLGNAELRFPVVPRWNVGMELFFDSGNVWESWRDVSSDDFRLTGDVVDERAEQAWRTSFGLGLTYRTVVGPLRLDYGIPLRRATFNSRDDAGVITGTEKDPDHVWHFSLGHAF